MSLFDICIAKKLGAGISLDAVLGDKYAVIDLGTLDWDYNGENAGGTGQKRWSSGINDMRSETVNVAEGLFCAKYAANNSPVFTTGRDKTIARYGTGVYVNDNSYASVSDFKSALNGVYLIYEKAGEI